MNDPVINLEVILELILFLYNPNEAIIFVFFLLKFYFQFSPPFTNSNTLKLIYI